MKCPKCHYERRQSDNAPDWQCPSCGIAYSKFTSSPYISKVEPIHHKSFPERLIGIVCVVVGIAASAFVYHFILLSFRGRGIVAGGIMSFALVNFGFFKILFGSADVDDITSLPAGQLLVLIFITAATGFAYYSIFLEH